MLLLWKRKGDCGLAETKVFSDELLTCESCGTEFVFRIEDQRRMYETRGEVIAPAECPACQQRDEETGKWRGEVKWFDARKGYGFIRKPDGEEIFFHRSSLVSVSPSEINEGQDVLFREEDTAKGPEAIEVELVAEA